MQLKKVILLLTLTILVCCFKLPAQNASVVTARIVESQSGDFTRMIVVRDNEAPEIIPLKDYKAFGSASSANEILAENQKKINKLIKELVDRGYELNQSSFAVDQGVYHSMLVFIRQ